MIKLYVFFVPLTRREFIPILLLISLTLAACGGGSGSVGGPTITRFESSAAELRERAEATYTIHYVNSNELESFSDLIMIMNFDEDLLLIDSTPPSELIEGNITQTLWQIGDLSPNQTGSLQVTFLVDNRIEPNKCELTATIEIQGDDSEGNGYRDSFVLNIPIQGRPSCQEAYVITLTARPNITGTVDATDLISLIPPVSGVPFVTVLPTDTPFPSPMASPSPSATSTQIPTATDTATPEPTSTLTSTPIPTDTATPEPTSTPTSTSIPTPTPTITPSFTSTLAPTATETSIPTQIYTPSVTQTSTPDTRPTFGPDIPPPSPVQVNVSFVQSGAKS